MSDLVTVKEEVIQIVTIPADTVTVEQQDATIVQISPGDIVVTETAATIIINAGTQGPAGVPEEDKTFAKQLDSIDNSPSSDITTMYRGEAAVGSITSASVWRIRRIRIDDNTDGDIEEVWAETAGTANANFVHVWDDHLTILYS